MKAVNLKKNSMNSISYNNQIDLSDRQPCWYANTENLEDRHSAKWIVGLKESGEKKEEYSFKISDAGDVLDEGFWIYATSQDFAVRLIALFKNSGQLGVSGWITSGCT